MRHPEFFIRFMRNMFMLYIWKYGIS